MIDNYHLSLCCRTLLCALLGTGAVLSTSAPARAQQQSAQDIAAQNTAPPNIAAQYYGGTPAPGLHGPSSALQPGAIAFGRLRKGGPVAGYVQPVQITSELPGAKIAFAEHGAFGAAEETPAMAGMLIGPVYRLRVTEIPGYEAREVFPTVEVIDRMYPPQGAERRFPIPIELTAEDLRLAMEGHFITRVVYVEDPQKALPGMSDPEHPTWFDAGPGANPLIEAESLGRPVAIVRLGGRLPDERMGPDMQFLHGCPPVVHYAPRPIVVKPAEQVAR
jgi:hypothetical protein